jgi:hypothetical protein
MIVPFPTYLIFRYHLPLRATKLLQFRYKQIADLLLTSLAGETSSAAPLQPSIHPPSPGALCMTNTISARFRYDRREIIDCKRRNPTSLVFQNIDPPHPPFRPASVYPPPLLGEGGHTRRAERGVGGQYFGRRETLDCPLIGIISLRVR